MKCWRWLFKVNAGCFVNQYHQAARGNAGRLKKKRDRGEKSDRDASYARVKERMSRNEKIWVRGPPFSPGFRPISVALLYIGLTSLCTIVAKCELLLQLIFQSVAHHMCNSEDFRRIVSIFFFCLRVRIVIFGARFFPRFFFLTVIILVSRISENAWRNLTKCEFGWLRGRHSRFRVEVAVAVFKHRQ